MFHFQQLTAVTILASSLLVAGPAAATDVKVYPGAACLPQTAPMQYYYSRNIGGYSNLSDTQYATIVCPITRDNSNNVDGTGYVLVNVYNTRKTGLTCSLASRQIGLDLVQQTTKTANPSVYGDTSIFLDVGASANLGVYELVCRLPPRTAIDSYVVAESGRTDDNN